MAARIGHHLLSELPFGRPPGKHLPYFTNYLSSGLENARPLDKLPTVQKAAPLSGYLANAGLATTCYVSYRLVGHLASVCLGSIWHKHKCAKGSPFAQNILYLSSLELAGAEAEAHWR